MTPVVGYMGGKRRIAKRIVSLMPERFGLYIEPFVGMGAVYLQLRESGYTGLAILADAHTCVSAFWRLIHDSQGSNELVRACCALRNASSVEDFYSAAKQVPTNLVDRVALFLWLTNYSFGNRAPGMRGDRWYLQGCRISSGKMTPWNKICERIEKLAQKARKWHAEVFDAAECAIVMSYDNSVIYADPPYYDTSKYQSTCDNLMRMLDSAKGTVILSEMSDFPCSWPSVEISMTASLSQGVGANGKREERIFVKPQSML